ncbi:MAG: UDP-3-O-(3-hydroxymyristoyl)glucosamine N-acyltransferase [Tannerellaceae bacterium]|jgi:UDP-3-O-[3-hydroxymyristoyl] glucosamine N-acyltransferase|nr:UDP-3-O-(3-hydroxymyristoyl)glucosamine N-acyltransferase [Tannerellaceae bacterium]
MELTARQIAGLLRGVVHGDPETHVNTFAKIEEANTGSLSFLANPKYEHYLYNTGASVVLVNAGFVPCRPVSATLVEVENAYSALATLMNHVEARRPHRQGISTMASIAETASLGENIYVGAFAYIGEHTQIGANCRIYPYACIGDHVCVGDGSIVYPHVTVYDNCVIGTNCVLHAGSVVGADGFGFAPEGDQYNKIPQTGNVVLEEDVEVGANTTIDRAVMGSTVIRRGVKLDNLIQIGHNVEIGEDTVMAAQSGVAGSVKIGRHCMFGGQVGISGHLRVADYVRVGAQAGILGSVRKQGAEVMGSPAFCAKHYLRASVSFRRLPEMHRQLETLQQEIKALKQKMEGMNSCENSEH